MSEALNNTQLIELIGSDEFNTRLRRLARYTLSTGNEAAMAYYHRADAELAVDELTPKDAQSNRGYDPTQGIDLGPLVAGRSDIALVNHTHPLSPKGFVSAISPSDVKVMALLERSNPGHVFGVTVRDSGQEYTTLSLYRARSDFDSNRAGQAALNPNLFHSVREWDSELYHHGISSVHVPYYDLAHRGSPPPRHDASVYLLKNF